MTAEEFLAIPELEDRGLELDAGKLIETPLPSMRHARVCLALSCRLSEWVDDRGLGAVLGRQVDFLLDSANAIVRAPDCCVLLGRVSDWESKMHLTGSPTIAIEVISPSDTAEQIKRKITQYLPAGSKEVWVIYPCEHCVEVYTDGGMREYMSPGMLRSELLPGLEIKLESIFPD